jgi:hypothetical protein
LLANSLTQNKFFRALLLIAGRMEFTFGLSNVRCLLLSGAGKFGDRPIEFRDGLGAGDLKLALLQGLQLFELFEFRVRCGECPAGLVGLVVDSLRIEP